MELVIVESPAKAKTISKYLGENFRVRASVGHIRDLHDNALSLDGNLNPIYRVYEEKKQVVSRLQADAREATMVYLMSDSDREGEAIAWHLKELLNLQPDRYCRPRFKEITKASILKAIHEGGSIDMNLVHAQEGRRVLDRLIGYGVSPIMNKMYQAPSTGRVQTVATMLVVDRQLEINSFRKKPYFEIVLKFLSEKFDWSAHLELSNLIKSKKFQDEIVKDEKNDKWRVVKPAFAHALQEALFQRKNLEVLEIRRSNKSRGAPAAYTTSTMIQDASSKLGWSTDETMKVAQKLYESGLITYMRTDQPNLSDESIQEAQAKILQLQSAHLDNNSKSFIPSVPNRFPVPPNAQEGHEALRPTNFNLVASGIKDEKGALLYELIWKRALASQMAPMEYAHTEIVLRTSFRIKGEHLFFKAVGNMTTFEGFQLLYNESEDEGEDKSKTEAILPELSEGDTITSSRCEKLEKFTRPPPHYTESSLVKEMEKRDIARPSTFASTVATIIKRKYVLREGKNLEASKLAMNYIANIRSAFKFVDYEYTSDTEGKLDQIANGNVTYQQFINLENDILNRDINSFTTDNKGAFKQCPVCSKTSLLKSIGKKSQKEYWSCVTGGCDAIYPDKNGEPDTNYEPPVQSNYNCPRCEQEKLLLFKKNEAHQQRYFGCPSKSCNTIVQSTADTWNKEAPVADISAWHQKREYKCPNCEKANKRNSLLLGKRNPQKSMRYYFCESKDCDVVIPCTADSWNTEKPVPDLKRYVENHSYICPKCRKHFLNRSLKKGNWYCSGRNSQCRVFIPNKPNNTMKNEPDFESYQKELDSRVSCPRKVCDGHLILGQEKQNYFCSSKCGINVLKQQASDAPDLEEYNHRTACPSEQCQGKLVLTKQKTKFRCDNKSCDVLVNISSNGQPDIANYIEEMSHLKACPECGEKALRLSKGSPEKRPTFFCTGKCKSQQWTTFVPVNDHGEPDYDAYNRVKQEKLAKNNQ